MSSVINTYLVQQESDLVEDVLALRLFELLFVENLALLRKLALRQVRVGIGVLYRVLVSE